MEAARHAPVRHDDLPISDFLSFYIVPSTVQGHPRYSDIVAAYSFYYAPGSRPLRELIRAALILARNAGADVFNALDHMDHGPCVKVRYFKG